MDQLLRVFCAKLKALLSHFTVGKSAPAGDTHSEGGGVSLGTGLGCLLH